MQVCVYNTYICMYICTSLQVYTCMYTQVYNTCVRTVTGLDSGSETAPLMPYRTQVGASYAYTRWTLHAHDSNRRHTSHTRVSCVCRGRWRPCQHVCTMCVYILCAYMHTHTCVCFVRVSTDIPATGRRSAVFVCVCVCVCVCACVRACVCVREINDPRSEISVRCMVTGKYIEYMGDRSRARLG